MTDLIPLSAMGTTTAPEAQFGALSLRENTGLGLASLGLRRGQGVPAPFGLTLPQPGGWTCNGPFASFWIGPDQWMIEGADRALVDFAAQVKSEIPDGLISEQTDGWAAIDIRSEAGAERIDALLERLVNLPASATTPGRATRTVLEHMSVFVIRRSPDRLAILGMRSAFGSLWHAVSGAAERLQTDIKAIS